MNIKLNTVLNIVTKKCDCGKMAIKPPVKISSTYDQDKWWCTCMKEKNDMLFLLWKTVNKRKKKVKNKNENKSSK